MPYKTRLVNDERITKLLLLCKYYIKRELQNVHGTYLLEVNASNSNGSIA